jgi:hypothetical protein
MKVQEILSITEKELADISKYKPSKVLKGEGAAQLRKDQAMISKLSQRPVLNKGIRGALNFYKKLDKNEQIIYMQFPKSDILRKDKMNDIANSEIVNSKIYLESKLQQYKRNLLDGNSGKAKNVLLEMKDSLQKIEEQLNPKEKNSIVKKDKQAKIASETLQTTDQLSDLISKLLISFRDNVTGFEYSRFRINEIAQYDFNEYKFLTEPNFVPSANPISVQLQEFINKVENIIIQIVQSNPPMRRKWRSETVDVTPPYLVDADSDYAGSFWVYNEEDIMVDDGEVIDTHTTNYLIDLFIKYFLQYLASDLYEIENKILYPPGASTIVAFSEWFYYLYGNNDWSYDSISTSPDSPDLWKNSLDEVLVLLNRIYPALQIGNLKYLEGNGYDFRPYSSNSIAFGIKLNYKQNWSPMGIQSGETVKTIPLGPKQVEKISIKTTSSVKRVTNKETFTSIESDSESTNSSKLSNEIVNQSDSKLSASLETKVTIPIDVIPLGIDSKIGTELSSSTKETKSQLNETMEKTSQKMKNDVKISVSNEFQSSSEYDRSSEISNPNDDIAITYIYSKLQQQFELYTSLNEVSNVVFVPEKLPSVQEIQKDWIRRYDWIIAKNLLDDSFQSDLTAVLNDNWNGDTYESDLDVSHFKDVSKKAKDALPDFTSFVKGGAPGGAIMDIYQAQNEIYLRQLDKVRAIKERGVIADRSFQRLKEHIQQNILHYMRAIWSAEDKDQRLLRYHERLVPTRWVFVPNHSPEMSDEDGSFSGNFVPDHSGKSLRKLSSIIDPSGPVGFSGNCLIFNLKTDPSVSSLNEGLNAVKSHFIKYMVIVSDENKDLKDVNIIHISAVYAGFTNPTFSLRYDAVIKEWFIIEKNLNVRLRAINYNERTLYFEGVILTFDKEPAQDISFEILVFPTNFLEDPEQKYLPLTYELPSLKNSNVFWSDELINDMISFLPGLTTKIIETTIDKLDDNSKSNLNKYYYEYLYKKFNTKRLTVDTDNVMLDILVSDNVVLEDFKRIHRVVDVMKAIEEETKMKLENERRKKRIDKDELDDPDIENVHNFNIQNPI